MIRAVLFDLDDTLYPEADFFRSGFAVVATELQRRGVSSAAVVQALLESIHFAEGRERVLDKAAERLAFPAEWVPEMVSLFHSHAPQIRLPAESLDILTQLRRQYRLGIVTNGHTEVQRRKIAALAVERLVDAVVVSDELGRQHWKPDPLPFWTCCGLLRTDPKEAVVVGDHPDCDLRGAHHAGIPAIRLRASEGYFRNVPDPPDARAIGQITTLSELPAALGAIARQSLHEEASQDLRRAA